MSAPVRFLALILVGWAGVRAATLGMLPGFTVGYAKESSASRLPPIVASRLPPLPPIGSSPQYWAANAPPPAPPQVVYYLPYPYPGMQPPYPYPAAPAAQPIPPRAAWQLPSQGAAGPDFYTPIQPLDEWQVSSLEEFPTRQSRPVTPISTGDPADGRLDRLQLTSWALLRGNPEPGALATGGTLGGSQAGARLTYNFNRWLAASLRTTSPVGGSRGAEVAAGVRFVPLRSIPVAITAERRQSISPHGGGRSAFALFAEGGVYGQSLPLGFSLDSYLQAGIVGLNSRDLFADGALAVSRPVWGRFSAAFGVWGGVQPGLYRIDAGPRVSIRLRDNIHAHLDWRQRLAGSARPDSGPALTLAADF